MLSEARVRHFPSKIDTIRVRIIRILWCKRSATAGWGINSVYSWFCLRHRRKIVCTSLLLNSAFPILRANDRPYKKDKIRCNFEMKLSDAGCQTWSKKCFTIYTWYREDCDYVKANLNISSTGFKCASENLKIVGQ